MLQPAIRQLGLPVLQTAVWTKPVPLESATDQLVSTCPGARKHAFLQCKVHQTDCHFL